MKSQWIFLIVASLHVFALSQPEPAYCVFKQEEVAAEIDRLKNQALSEIHQAQIEAIFQIEGLVQDSIRNL